MANEATVNSGFSITKSNLKHRSYPTQFQATVSGSKGPTPGAFTASLLGTQVDLSELENPGLCRISNLDSDNFVEWGVYDGNEFYPLGEILPGEFYVFRLSRFLGRSIGSSDPGTGTFDLGTYRFMIKATVAPCNVSVEAFER